MSKFYFIVGSSAAGKSTTERNLRLRSSCELSNQLLQHVPDQDLVFVGRVAFANGKKVLRKSGGDSIWYDWSILDTALLYADKVVFEKYEVPPSVYKKLVNAGHDVVLFHILVHHDIAVNRLIHLEHRNAFKEDRIYYKPGDPEYQSTRDNKLADLGIQVVYLEGDLKSRCKFIENYMDISPKYDHVIYDFNDSMEDIVSRFKSGGDPERTLDGVK